MTTINQKSFHYQGKSNQIKCKIRHLETFVNVCQVQK